MTRCINGFGWTLCLALAVLSVESQGNDVNDVDWNAWRLLPVQDGGRRKPFDSLAREMLRNMTGRESITDPDTGDRLEPVAAYLAFAFDWQGWDGATRSDSVHGQRPANPYFGRHTADRWDRLPLLPVPEADLRELLSLPRGVHAIAPYELSQAKIEVPESHEQRPFIMWAERIGPLDVDRRTPLESQAWALLQRYWEYQRHRMGSCLLLVPSRDGTRTRWMSLGEVVTGRYDESSDPSGTLRAMQQAFAAARHAYRSASQDVRTASMKSLWLACSELSKTELDPRQQAALRWEVWSNRWRPFRWSWGCLCLAALLLAASSWKEQRWCTWFGWLLYAGGSLAACVGVTIRVAVGGRWLGANTYESVVLVGVAAVGLGLLGSLVERRRVCLLVGASAGAILLGIADTWGRVLDPSLQPLHVALRNTPWFVAHGITTVLGLAFLVFNAAVSNVVLVLTLCRSPSPAHDAHLLPLLERTAHWGTTWLAAGLVTGALWAERAWGRFWDWDPKEVWTLIALLAYLAAQHARSASWLQKFGTAALHALCFQLVMVAWYGVNCVKHTGRHEYGFSTGSAFWLYAILAVQIIVVAAAGVRVAWHAHQVREARRLGLRS